MMISHSDMVQPLFKIDSCQKKRIVMQERKECWVTGQTNGLHKHHIFGGKNRKLSEKYGLFVWLRPDWHNMSDYGVHFNSTLDSELKQEAQKKFEEIYSRDEFRRLFGKSYL